MSQSLELNRRTFLKSAGVTAVLGAVGAKPALAITETNGVPPTLLYPTYDFDERYDRVGTDCSKWDSPIATFGEDIEVAMGIADMDFRAPPCVTRALAERCAHENWGYLRRPESYVQSIVDWNKRRYDLDVDPSTVVLTTGVHAGLIAALQTFAPPGSRVLMTAPIYSGFYSDLRFTRTVPEDSPMKLVDGRYSVDFEDFERRARRCNVFIFCNPQNPTGNLWSAEDMTRMGEICLEHRVVVLVDEIHCDFVSSGEQYIPFASLANREIVNNSITYKSASKSFSLSGLKAAWYFSDNRDYLERVGANTRADLNTLGMVATQAALTEGDEWLDESLAYLDANHDFAEAYIRDHMPLVKYTKAQGTYLAWLDVSEVVEKIGAKSTAAEESASSEEQVTPERIVQRWFAEHARVYLNPGSSYGTGGAGHMRMNLATTRWLVERALGNMASALTRV